jgi:hypothetical protein
MIGTYEEDVLRNLPHFSLARATLLSPKTKTVYDASAEDLLVVGRLGLIKDTESLQD